MNGTLNAHLEEIDNSAEEMMDRLTTQLSEQDDISESLKAANQIAWVQSSNNVQNCAEELVIHELINV